MMGHSNCGGIRALMTRDAFSGYVLVPRDLLLKFRGFRRFSMGLTFIVCESCSDFVGSWIRIGLPAKKKALSVMKGKPLQEQCRFCEQVWLLSFLFFSFSPLMVHILLG